MTAVHFAEIAHAYGTQRVLDNLSLRIRSGELFTLLGPSGCGKTTLLRIAAGFIRPLLGRVVFDNEDLTDVPPYRRNVGMVFQDYALFPDRSVFENVAYGLRARRCPETQVKTRVNSILERFGLQPFSQRGPAALSGGQRQRVAMARALVISPRMLLLDEPLSALDAKLRIEFRDMIRGIQQEFRITTLFVTHDQEEALSISDRVALMRDGELVQVGSPAEIYDSPANRFAADFIGGANILDAEVVERHASSGSATCKVEDVVVTISGDRVNLRPGSVGGTLCIRTEAWSLEQPSQNTRSSLLGEVAGKQFLGAQVLYTVRLRSGSIVRCSAPHQFGRPAYEIGAGVALTIPPTAMLVGE